MLGIVAALDVPVIHKAVQWWRGQHPQVFKPGEDSPLAPEMRTAFLAGIVAFFTLYALLLLMRSRLAAQEDRVQDLLDRAEAP